MEYVWKYHSPMGKLMMASDGENLTGLWFEEQKYYASTISEKVVEKKIPIFEKTIYWLERYFHGEKRRNYRITTCPTGKYVS